MTECPFRIGNQTSLTTELLGPFEYALSNRFSAFEWFPDGWDVENIALRTREYIREMSRVRDISLSVHLPWHANPLRSSFELFRSNIFFAKEIGAGLVNIHFHEEEGTEAYLLAITPIIRLTAEEGIRLSIENTVHTGPEAFNRLFSAIHEMGGAEHVGMCLDMGHANLCSETRNDYLGFLDLLNPSVPIIHLHVHENYGDADSHLPLFTGPSGSDPAGVRGLLNRLLKRGFSGSLILEQWPDPPSLLNEARERLCLIAGAILTEESEKAQGDYFLDTLVEADRRNLSWREKLLWVRDALAEGIDAERLVAVALYLRFIGLGQIPCQEDGHHYRPGHNARAAEEIEELLSHATDPDLGLIIRKIHPWLPSYGEPFKRAEPLTRIREIAHRNDIPQDLKREIKQTLQNKLHRCAGPEDLVTSEGILKRLTAPGADYSPAFEEEFRIFHEELKEFFNARGVEELLETLIRKGIADREGEELIASFLAAKTKADPFLGDEVHLLQSITGLRAHLISNRKGLKGAEAQQLRLADIGLEDYAFACASGIMNRFPEVKHAKDWEPLLELLILLVENLRLSGLYPDECRAIGSHLRLMGKGFCARDRNHLLQVRAELERCRRLTQGYTDRVLSLFAEKVERLGRMLGLPETAIRY
ncbi:MAG: TIM barrel protein, partial [Thermodesulfovibrionales bacterium]